MTGESLRSDSCQRRMFNRKLGKTLPLTKAAFKIDCSQTPAVVFQSDDWGACRVFNNLEEAERVSKYLDGNYVRYNGEAVRSTLEKPEDLDRLFTILLKHTGGDGLPAVYTANYVTCNPDYSAIRRKNFKELFTLEIPAVPSNWERGDFITKAKEGMDLGVWDPQYHGMLHMNPFQWMKLLRRRHEQTRALFDSQSFAGMNGINCAEYSKTETEKEQRLLVSKGLEAFKKAFGYHSHSAVAPNYVWQPKTEKLLAERGIKVIQGKNLQAKNSSVFGRVKDKIVKWRGIESANRHCEIEMGDRNIGLGIIYLVRNVTFEPLIQNGIAAVEKALETIRRLWSEGQPAVICTHRFNFTALNESLRNESFMAMDALLDGIEKLNPNVRYLTDWELGQQYLKGYSVRKIGRKLAVRNFTNSSRELDVGRIADAKPTEMVVTIQNGRSRSAILKSQTFVVSPHSTCVMHNGGSEI